MFKPHPLKKQTSIGRFETNRETPEAAEVD